MDRQIRIVSLVAVMVVLLSLAVAAAGPALRPVLLDAASRSASGGRIALHAAVFRAPAAGPGDPLRGRIPPSLRAVPGGGGLLLVAFDPGTAPDRVREILRRHGGKWLGYVPDSAALARVDAAAAGALAAEPAVRWVGPFHPFYKLSRALPLPLPPGASGADPLAGRGLDIHLAQDVDLAAGQALAGRLGLAVQQAGGGRLRLRVGGSAQALALLRAPEVVFVEPSFQPLLLNNSSRGICQSGTPGVDSLHDRGIRGGGQVVAVMDSGLDTAHCCFSGAGKVQDNRAWGGGTLGADCSGDHGTHVSGTAACENGGDHDGLAPDAGLLMQDIGKSGNCVNVYPPNPLSDAWSDARSRGARVHTNSWGGGFNLYGGDSQAIDSFMWDNQDFLILYAAGNEGPAEGTLGIYSNAKNSVTVGGSGNGSSRESMYSASSRGPAGDGRMLPDLTAPAAGVSSARSGTSCGWTSKWGTSMATPAVAGTAALAREYFVRGFYPTGTETIADGFEPSAALVKATLLISAREMSGSGVGGSRPNNNQGFGRLTLDDALWFEGEEAATRLTVLDDRDTSTGLATPGAVDTFQLDLPQAGDLRVMLVWTDAPGASFAGKALVNDLDLEVELADGSLYAGNQGFNGGWTTTTATARDRLNNKEAVYLQSLAAQTVTIRVVADSLGDVAAHPQDYALVVLSPASPTGCDAPPPDGVGNSVSHEKSGGELLASWADRGADHYVVYRGESPDFMNASPPPYQDAVTDEDAARPGVQWTDTGALGDGQTHYYLYASVNACGDEVP
ncbi:MAG TPA: hypothetical protein ENK10_06325 [Acidobacteria bacterium]|nr:hypothetical protein [Acidobacteriota bacterium]